MRRFLVFVHSDSVTLRYRFVNFAAFSPDGEKVLTGSSDNTARLWDVASDKELLRLVGHTYWIESVAFSPDGEKILTGSRNNTARLWDVKDEKVLWETPLPFSNEDTWDINDIILWLFLIFLFFFLPTIRLFDPNHILYLRSPNKYLPLYDLPNIERWLPKEHIINTT